MRVIPVIDLMHGCAVRAVAGNRAEYQPVTGPWQDGGDTTVSVASVYVKKFGFDMAYVADLDAIQGRSRNEHRWEQIARKGLKLWLDAGVSGRSSGLVVQRELSRFASNYSIIAGLESLGAYEYLGELVELFGPETLVFSVDLKGGRALTQIETWMSAEPIQIVREVAKAGIRRFIVLDLADVGVAGGTRTLDLCRQIRGEFPGMELTAGGGVRGIDDLRKLAEAGCDAALVASALHDGLLTAEDVREAERWQR